ncbi:MAG: DUF1488 domain-containing protein [Hyphomicrobiales bacterium]|nr:DUF1488 domain-containing protein [Hyphomicrobiales bacterium]
MTLKFPNLSRSYDSALKRVRFSAYDGVFEVPFFVEVDALAVMTSPPASTEAGYLSAFDKAREAIQDVACRVYRGRKTMYVLTSSDFG